MSDFVTLKSNSDFRRLYNRGKAVTDPALVVYYSKNRAGICRIGITTSNAFENSEKIDLEQYIDKDKLLKYEDEIFIDKNVFDEMINYGISNLNKAKAKHDVIEAYYIPNMKFDEIDKFKDDLLNRIKSYEK